MDVGRARKLKQLERENGRLKMLAFDQSLEGEVLRDIAEAGEGPRQGAVDAVRENYNLGECDAGRIAGRPHAMRQCVPILKPDGGEPTRNIVLIASNYGRDNWRRVAAQKWLPRSSASGCRVLARGAGTVSPDRLARFVPVKAVQRQGQARVPQWRNLLQPSRRREGVIGPGRTQYKARGPHLAPGYRPPAPRTITPPPALYGTAHMQ